MSLTTLGLTEEVLQSWEEWKDGEFILARVLVQHRDRYVVQTETDTRRAEITGKLRYTATDGEDLPAVGDWVKVIPTDEDSGIILDILPRKSVLKRRAVGQHGASQLIAANIDYAFIVQAIGHDFNLNRLERYLALTHAANIQPIVVLTKTDLIKADELTNYLDQLRERTKEIPIIPVSILQPDTLNGLRNYLLPGKTFCFIGSSGVGKSSLINAMGGGGMLKTQSISETTNKGRHTTTHRELMVLPGGAIVIDTPGMREIGMVDVSLGIETTFSDIGTLADNCQFTDCRHEGEKGCAVQEAIEAGKLTVETLESYRKLKREQEHFSSTVKQRRDKDKSLGKLYKSIQRANRKRK